MRRPDGSVQWDDVATEEPLEIRVDGQALAVLMRSPGADADLAAGFLLTEGVIDGPDDIVAMAPCPDPNRPARENVLLVRLAPGCDTSRLSRAQRDLTATASCGVCGKASIDAVHQNTAPHDRIHPIARGVLEQIGDEVRTRQTAFEATGGIHAAAVVDADGTILALAEDIGRHNAVDKVLGRLLRAGATPLVGRLLWVSGRCSFEVVQKAVMGGITGVIAVGAPTSLAVELARESNLSLVCFARGADRFTIYAGAITPS